MFYVYQGLFDRPVAVDVTGCRISVQERMSKSPHFVIEITRNGEPIATPTVGTEAETVAEFHRIMDAISKGERVLMGVSLRMGIPALKEARPMASMGTGIHIEELRAIAKRLNGLARYFVGDGYSDVAPDGTVCQSRPAPHVDLGLKFDRDVIAFAKAQNIHFTNVQLVLDDNDQVLLTC